MRRKKKRKLKRWFKIFIIVVPCVVIAIGAIVYGFKLKDISVSSDLNQFSKDEVLAYLKHEEVNNTLIFWTRDKIKKEQKLDLFEEYDLKMESPFKVKVVAYETKLKGYIKADNLYYYLDGDGKVLKVSSEKMKGVPIIEGLEYKSLKLYEKVKPKDKNVLETVLEVSEAIEKYNYDVKKIKVNDKCEASIYIKNIQVDFGKLTSLDKKLRDFNDLYDNVIKYRGVLNMKHVSTDGSYTLKKSKKSTKKAKKEKNN